MKNAKKYAPLWMPAAALLCVLALFLASPETPAPALESAAATPFPTPRGLRVAVASDTHFDPDHTDKQSDLGETVYNMEIADAMLHDVKAQGAKLLLLTGDLCNSGKRPKHEALVEKLRAAEAEGLTVYVLPGNHDLAPLKQSEFAALYADFGFAEAYSRDSASLSYCVLRDDVMLLMMDTAGYGVSAIDLPGAPKRADSNAFFTEETLHWAEELLQTAREKDIPVLAAGHYNLLPEISRTENTGYYVENGVRFASLLREYGVKLTLSGHMHLRAVYEEDGLTEQLTECLIAYPTGYTVLDLTPDTIRVLPRRVDVERWAAETGQTDPVLRGFDEWQEQGLEAYCRETVEAMTKKNPLKEGEKESATRFFNAVMRAYWDGSLAERRETLRQLEGYDSFFRAAEGYSYGWWLRDLIETASPKLAGFEIDFH